MCEIDGVIKARTLCTWGYLIGLDKRKSKRIDEKKKLETKQTKNKKAQLKQG